MRIAVGVEYDGSAYCGWQRLSHADSVQGRVEAALTKVASHPVNVMCAGRTDSGVHAIGQVIHFDTEAERSQRNWLFGGNTHLPADIALRWVQPVTDDFHARFSAQARSYRYMILNRDARPGMLRHRAAWFYNRLDDEKMHQAAQVLLGEQDFSSFRAAGCQAPHAMREVQAVRVSRVGEMVYVDIRANAFLYHMVRNIVGSLVEIGMGKQSEDWIANLLQQQNRRLAAATAPAQGLYFVHAFYPSVFNLPNHEQVPACTF